MEKPLTLREETWQFFLEITNAMDDKELLFEMNSLDYDMYEHATRTQLMEALSEKPGPFLIKHNWLHFPHLVAETVVELPDEVDYVVTLEGAEALKNGDSLIPVTCLWDCKKSYARADIIVSAWIKNDTLDQLSYKKPPHD